MSIGERIKQLREDEGLTQPQLAERIFKDRSTISKLESDKIKLSRSICRAICLTFNIREQWLLTGRGEKTREKQDEMLLKSVIDSASRHVDHPDSEFVYIPFFYDRLSAGRGFVPNNDVEIKLAFRRGWLKKKGDSTKMSLIRVSGDSMEPTLMQNDLVLINHGHNNVDHQGGVYAITIDDHIMIKRLQVTYPSGKIKIISDNKKYESTEVSLEKINVNGKLIWFAREI